MLIPIIKGWGISGWVLFVVASTLAVAELFCWFQFWKWFCKIAVKENEKIQEVIKLGKEIHFDLKKAGLWEKIKKKILDWIFNNYKRAANENNGLMKWVKRGGVVAMVGLGISPEPGTRAFGAMFCGVTGLKNGLYPLAIGNILRIAYMVGLWHIVFSFFKN